jgi:hypothetical protein
VSTVNPLVNRVNFIFYIPRLAVTRARLSPDAFASGRAREARGSCWSGTVAVEGVPMLLKNVFEFSVAALLVLRPNNAVSFLSGAALGTQTGFRQRH